MLLDNSFNLSINSSLTDETYILAIINYLNLYVLLYIIIGNIYDKHITDEENYKNKINECRTIIIPNDLDFISDKEQQLLDLIKIDSLERQIILYFIFKMHGKFRSDTYTNSYESIIEDNIQSNEYNAFYEYNFWRDIYGGEHNFNLDETLPNELIIIRDDKIWEVNKAHINFIYWLQYSGLYDYIFAEEQIYIKKTILDDMNLNKILVGNNFLKYQLFLINYKEMYQAQLDNNTECDSDCYTDSLDDSSNSQYETQSEETDDENIDQTNKLNNILGINDVDKYMFLEDLKYSCVNICKTAGKAIYKSIFNVWSD